MGIFSVSNPKPKDSSNEYEVKRIEIQKKEKAFQEEQEPIKSDEEEEEYHGISPYG